MRNILRTTVAASAFAMLTMPMLTAAAFAGSGEDDAPRFVLPYYGHIDPFYGDINPFYGDINPFYGDISPFWGDISPFWGDINPFYGDISAFWGSIDSFYGDINPFWGDIAPFWGDIGPFWGDISAFWGDISPFDDGATGDYSPVLDQLKVMFDRAEGVFGAAVEAQTGQSFHDAFLNGLLARYGIDLTDPDSLAAISAAQRSAFFLDFYDGLMAFSGTDRVDHWMPGVNWSPALSQRAGGGAGVVVGLLDFNFDSAGYKTRGTLGERDYFNFNHGAAVAGLIAAAHDGQGVMGVAPGVTLATYNPFDATLSTNWNDVTLGVRSLLDRRARIVNLSLGMRGWTLPAEWADVLSDSRIARNASNALLVIAAGNEGFVQTANVDWTRVGSVRNLLVVGSVGPTGEISAFSNRPGTACLTVNGACPAGHRLMDRFLVAPGELILVSDGEGGVIRMSGTSFAAPLVSGAAALVFGRWGWLQAHDVADILLRSARDLGEPGVDAVYGRGMLDIGAAMSPLDRNNLFAITDKSERVAVPQPGFVSGQISFHSIDENAIRLFEDINTTFRDFIISLNDITLGSEYTSAAARRAAEIYMAERSGWPTGARFNDAAGYAATLSMQGNMLVTAFAAPRDPRASRTSGSLGFQAGVQILDTATGRELRFGAGEGAMALNSQTGFGLFSDHRPETGGVNPVLGFASGGGYVMTGLALNETTRLSVGMTSTYEELVFVMPFTGEERRIFDGLSAYEAVAFNADIRHDLTETVRVSASYTYLHEGTGLLGAQGTGPLAFHGGAETDALTFGADADLPHRLTLSASATFARTRGTGFDGGILDMPDAVISTAFQITARRDGVFGDRDGLRFSIIQPLHVESGALDYTSARVADRETGELTIETDRWELGGQRPLIAELLYATPVLGQSGNLSIFARARLSGDAASQDVTGIASGARLAFRF